MPDVTNNVTGTVGAVDTSSATGVADAAGSVGATVVAGVIELITNSLVQAQATLGVIEGAIQNLMQQRLYWAGVVAGLEQVASGGTVQQPGQIHPFDPNFSMFQVAPVPSHVSGAAAALDQGAGGGAAAGDNTVGTVGAVAGGAAGAVSGVGAGATNSGAAANETGVNDQSVSVGAGSGGSSSAGAL